MATEELLKYVKDCRKKGFSDSEIRNALVERGWNQKDVLEAILARPSKRLPKAVSMAGLIFAVLLVGAVIWAVFFMLNDIRKISDEVAVIPKQVHGPTEFCGTSTKGQCSSDADCIAGGCSGQVCQSKSEEPAITTCEYRDCYNNQAYGVVCKCVNNKCQWKK